MQKLILRLYVAGSSPNSLRAVANLRQLCGAQAAAGHEVEIIDVLKEPGRALADGVFISPTLVKVGPLPKRSIVGNLSDERSLRHALGLTEGPPP